MQTANSASQFSIWIQWIITFTILLIYVSLWMTTSLTWHFSILFATLTLLWYTHSSPLRTLIFIISLILFLVCLQLLFSSFMRDLLFRSLEEGFKWSEWSYLMFAVERLAWPLIIVSTFQTQLSNPRTAAGLSSLLTPLHYLGFNIFRLQSILILALKFMPTLKREWRRLAYFQTYFSKSDPQRSLIEKIRYYQGTLKAMIAHVVARAVSTGDLLALRGLPVLDFQLRAKDLLLTLLPWMLIGLLTWILEVSLFILWCFMTIWMLASIISIRRAVAS